MGSPTQLPPCACPTMPPASQTKDPPPPILHPRRPKMPLADLPQELLRSEQTPPNTTGDFPYHKISCLRSQWANTPYATWTDWSDHIYTSLFILKSVAFQQPRTSPFWDLTFGALQRTIQAIITREAYADQPVLSWDKLDYILSVLHRWAVTPRLLMPPDPTRVDIFSEHFSQMLWTICHQGGLGTLPPDTITFRMLSGAAILNPQEVQDWQPFLKTFPRT
jgi:hypothetical protein